jgi:uncharacterized protein YecT (DUF1311 family)
MAGRFVVAASVALVVSACLGLAPSWAVAQGQAQSKGPAFDCSKASGEVEKLICADAGLAALDRKLDAVYKAAMAKARDDVPKFLRTEQRGWVKGRDECWKAKGAGAPVYLTESWIATDVRGCVEAQYQLRTAELQVLLRLVPSQKPVSFACNGNAVAGITAEFFQTDPPAARFERGDGTVTAYQVRTAGGAKYEGQNFSFSKKGNEATVTWLGEQLTCKAQ